MTLTSTMIVQWKSCRRKLNIHIDCIRIYGTMSRAKWTTGLSVAARLGRVAVASDTAFIPARIDLSFAMKIRITWGNSIITGEYNYYYSCHTIIASYWTIFRITISPPTNFLTKTPTIIKHDEHEFIFEGFSLLSHEPIGELPTCKVIRFNIQYTIMYVEEQSPENFTIRELDLFCKYLLSDDLFSAH